MEEQEYINVKALGTITAAINTLRDLTPANLKGIIKNNEWEKVMPTLINWQERIFKSIKTK